MYSAAGVTLPSQHGAPPMTTQRPTLAAISGLLHISLSRAAVALDGKPGQFVVESLNVRDIVLMKDSVAARELPADKFQRKAAEQDGAGSLGIDPDVVFGRWRHVPFTARCPSHDHTAPDFGSD